MWEQGGKVGETKGKQEGCSWREEGCSRERAIKAGSSGLLFWVKTSNTNKEETKGRLQQKYTRQTFRQCSGIGAWAWTADGTRQTQVGKCREKAGQGHKAPPWQIRRKWAKELALEQWVSLGSSSINRLCAEKYFKATFDSDQGLWSASNILMQSVKPPPMGHL